MKCLGIYVGHITKDCQKLNTDKIIDKTSKLITQWEKRKLTLYGKITVTKTLLLPNITYVATNTVIPKEVLRNFNSMLFNFIWSGKKDKIKRSILTKKYEEGGLNMTDIETYLKAIHLKWIKRLHDDNLNANWKVLPKYFLNQLGQDLIVFKMNLKNVNQLDKKILIKIPTFYQELLKTWIDQNANSIKEPKNYLDLRKQVIWGNVFSKFQNKILIYEKWIASNILFVNDIIDDKGNISTEVIFSKLKDKTNWIAEISTLRKAIPKTWQEIIKSETSYKTKVKINSNKLMLKNAFDLFEIPNDQIYKTLMSFNRDEKPLGIIKWERHLETNLYFELKNAFRFITYFIQDNKIKVFRWKILHYILPCKELLYQWKITTDNLCNACKVKEDYKHFFIECLYFKEFWSVMKELLSLLKIGPQIINLKTLAMGYKIHDENYNHINLLLAYMFYSVYKTHYVSQCKVENVNAIHIFCKEIGNLRLMNQHLGKKECFWVEKVYLFLSQYMS